MLNFDKETVNHLITQLDDDGYLFPQFELSKLNSEPIVLGYGGFSSVFEMVNKERPDVKYALKVIGFERHTLSSSNFWDTGKIQWILCQDTKYIVRVLDARELKIDIDENEKILHVSDVVKESWEEEEQKELHLQFVLMEKLDRIIEKNRFKKVSILKDELRTEKEVLKFAFEIGQALNTAHSYSVLHRDIKLENIFWDDFEKIYKLGDFGISKYSEDGNAETVVYTDGYGAPEIERRLYDYYNITADIYSFGITLYLLLNNLKFPGSDGYYPKVEVQYNPDYVFPAPENGSEGITKVIRKMCSFRAEDRYQNMAQVLNDLYICEKIDDSEMPAELVDMVTETYHQENVKEDEGEERPKSRAERKQEQKIVDQLYKEDSVKYGIFITLILTLLFRGMHGELTETYNWLFLSLPVMVLFEAMFQRIKEFHLFFGALTVGVVCISSFQIGVTMPHIIMLLAVIIGCPVLTVASSISTGLWFGLVISHKLTFLAVIWKYDLGWIFLIILFIAVNRYFHMRIEWEKTSYIRAYIGTFVYDKAFLVMIGIGMVLWILQKMQLIMIPEIINRMHFIRCGVITFIVICILFWWDGYLDDEEDLTEEYESGDGYIGDANNLDE